MSYASQRMIRISEQGRTPWASLPGAALILIMEQIKIPATLVGRETISELQREREGSVLWGESSWAWAG